MEIFTGLEHIAIAARDPEGLAAWYCRWLGFVPGVEFDNGAEKPKTCFVRARNGPYLEIMPAGPLSPGSSPLSGARGAAPGLAHLAILVRDFDRAAESLVGSGAQREGEERAAPGGARVQFYRDPAGNLFHILFRPNALGTADKRG